MLFDKIAYVYFICEIYLYFSIGNDQLMEPALCQLYRHTFVPCVHPYCDLMKLLLSWMQDLVAQTRSTVRVNCYNGGLNRVAVA